MRSLNAYVEIICSGLFWKETERQTMKRTHCCSLVRPVAVVPSPPKKSRTRKRGRSKKQNVGPQYFRTVQLVVQTQETPGLRLSLFGARRGELSGKKARGEGGKRRLCQIAAAFSKPISSVKVRFTVVLLEENKTRQAPPCLRLSGLLPRLLLPRP